MNEKNILEQIEVVNDMLGIICQEIENLDNIDEYNIELEETTTQWLIEEKPSKKYKIVVTVKKHIEVIWNEWGFSKFIK